MHRRQNARADKECADQRERKAQNGKQDGPDLERVALFHHHRRMKERRARDPRHQRCILDRIPEPPSAPAEFVIGPVRTHGDAERHEDPCGQDPRPRIARPGRIDAAFDQSGNGKRKRNRKADIAEIEERRMDREPDILQQRIEVASLGRRARDAQERIRARENKEIKRRRDPGLNAERIGAQARRQILAKGRDHRAEHAQDQHPEQHRAFVVSPHAREFVNKRHRRMRILEHIEHREVGADITGGQSREGDRNKNELRQGERPRRPGQHAVAKSNADQRHRALDERQAERQDQRVMSDLGDHCFLPCAGSGFLP